MGYTTHLIDTSHLHSAVLEPRHSDHVWSHVFVRKDMYSYRYRPPPPPPLILSVDDIIVFTDNPLGWPFWLASADQWPWPSPSFLDQRMKWWPSNETRGFPKLKRAQCTCTACHIHTHTRPPHDTSHPVCTNRHAERYLVPEKTTCMACRSHHRWFQMQESFN